MYLRVDISSARRCPFFRSRWSSDRSRLVRFPRHTPGISWANLVACPCFFSSRLQTLPCSFFLLRCDRKVRKLAGAERFTHSEHRDMASGVTNLPDPFEATRGTPRPVLVAIVEPISSSRLPQPPPWRTSELQPALLARQARRIGKLHAARQCCAARSPPSPTVKLAPPPAERCAWRLKTEQD